MAQQHHATFEILNRGIKDRGLLGECHAHRVTDPRLGLPSPADCTTWLPRAFEFAWHWVGVISAWRRELAPDADELDHVDLLCNRPQNHCPVLEIKLVDTLAGSAGERCSEEILNLLCAPIDGPKCIGYGYLAR